MACPLVAAAAAMAMPAVDRLGYPQPVGLADRWAWVPALLLAGAAILSYGPLALAGVASLVLRARQAGPNERAQLLWLAGGAASSLGCSCCRPSFTGVHYR